MFRKILLLALVLAGIAALIGYQKYNEIFGTNVPDTLQSSYVQIPTHSSYQEVVDLLYSNGFIIDTTSFNWVAQRMNYKKADMRSGRFKIEGGWSNRKLIRHLRGGKQSPVKVVLNTERLASDIAGKVSKAIEADSMDLLRLLQDEAYLSKHQLNKETMPTAFIPNTYELFWNTNEKAFFERMIKEREKFWAKDNRLKKAQKLELNKEEVYTLASIVERETNKNQEKARIAGLYYNRLKKGMLLQADPTVVFAVGDFGLRRVLFKHLEIDSPYNTYKNLGLPPGPISLASIASIDGVLNMEDHNYVYFCAKGDGSGLHNFAKTLSGHNANAVRYRRNLKKRGLR